MNHINFEEQQIGLKHLFKVMCFSVLRYLPTVLQATGRKNPSVETDVLWWMLHSSEILSTSDMIS